MLREFRSKNLLIGAISVASGIAVSSLWLAAQQPGGQELADIILHNGKILTVDSQFSTAEAVAIASNKIAAVGRNEEVLQQAGPNTLKLDLKGRTVIPGLMDSHMNDWSSPGAYREALPPDKTLTFSIDWRAVSKKEDVLNQIQGFIDRYKPAAGAWLRFQNDPRTDAHVRILFEELNRYDLDKAAPNNPIVLTMGIPNENGLFVNSRAIEILWKNDGDFIKKYGRYWLGTDGQPDGRLEPPATRLILAKYMPRATPEEMAPAYRKIMEELNSWGITTISNKMRLNSIDAFKILERRSEQTVRLSYGLGWDYFGVIPDPDEGLEHFRGVIGSGTDLNWVNSIAPSSIDGGGGGRACTNLKRVESERQTGLGRYFSTGQCFTDSEYSGGGRRPARISGNYFQEWVMAVGRHGLRLADNHVAGDRTTTNLLNMMEEVAKKYGSNATKDWTFDHCTMVNPRDIPRAVRLGIIFACTSREDSGGGEMAQVYGEEVAHTFSRPVKSIIDAGGKVAYNSGTYGYPWGGLEWFVTRKDADGKVWGPQERLDRPTALKTATRWNADYVLKGDKLGSIEPGKLADLVVIDKDYLTIPAEEIHTIQAELTIFDGRIVFVHTNFANEYNLRPAGAVISTRQELEARRSRDQKGGRTGNDGLR